MKKCISCGNNKSLDEFYAHPKMGDGHLNRCKECCKRYGKQRRILCQDEVRAKDRAKYLRERKERLEASREYKANRSEVAAMITKRYRRRYPWKYSAHQEVRRALEEGRLHKKPCQSCGDPQSQAHHRDYSKPLDVVWLCDTCHKREHGFLVGDAAA